jgi:hypothetical protein
MPNWVHAASGFVESAVESSRRRRVNAKQDEIMSNQQQTRNRQAGSAWTHAISIEWLSSFRPRTLRVTGR